MDTRGDIPTPHQIVNLAMCMAVSIDTCTAVARLLSQFWKHTCTQVTYPQVFAKPVPLPIETHTPGYRYRFSGVQVWVALENARVTHANP